MYNVIQNTVGVVNVSSIIFVFISLLLFVELYVMCIICYNVVGITFHYKPAPGDDPRMKSRSRGVSARRYVRKSAIHQRGAVRSSTAPSPGTHPLYCTGACEWNCV